jgi:AraC family ethanolamine operon transcriptional activator
VVTSPLATEAARGNCFAFSLRTHDFDQLANAVKRWDQQFEQLSGGRFVGGVHVLQIGEIQLTRFSVNQVIQARGLHPPDSYVFIPVSTTNTAATWRGRKLQPGPIVVLKPDQEHDHLTSQTETIVDLNISSDLLHRIADVSLKCDPEDLLNDVFAINAESTAGNDLQAMFTNLMDRTETQPELLANPWARAMLEGKCIQWVIGILERAMRDGKTEGRVSNPAQLVRRSEEYMMDRLRDPVTLLDLCEWCDVSERTLLYAFQDVLGMSPKAYLKAKRLNAVRQDLKASEPDDASVAEIAGRWGFWHTGNFAADYRRLFGELPSQTLGLSPPI